MTTALSIAVVSILVAAYYIRSFLIHRKKVEELNRNGSPVQGLLFEVRNIGKQNDSTLSRLNEVAVRFTTANGKSHIVRHRKELEEGEVIPVGSSVELTYLESDPAICNVPSLGITAQNKWTSLATGIIILVAGLFAAYVVFINIGTV